MKLKLKGRLFDTIEEIQAESQRLLDIVTEKDFQEAFQKWRRWQDRCYMREGTTSRVMLADMLYGEFYDFTVSVRNILDTPMYAVVSFKTRHANPPLQSDIRHHNTAGFTILCPETRYFIDLHEYPLARTAKHHCLLPKQITERSNGSRNATHAHTALNASVSVQRMHNSIKHFSINVTACSHLTSLTASILLEGTDFLRTSVELSKSWRNSK
jgi:hypothetical protein